MLLMIHFLIFLQMSDLFLFCSNLMIISGLFMIIHMVGVESMMIRVTVSIVIMMIEVMVEWMSVSHFLKIVLKESMWISLVWDWNTMVDILMHEIMSKVRISFRERMYIGTKATDVTIFKSMLFSLPLSLGFLCLSLPFLFLFSLLLLGLPLLLLSL